MTDATESIPQPIYARRLPICIAVTAAIMCLCLLTAWAASDASFRSATWKARVALRLESIPCADPEAAEFLGIMDAMRDIRWNSLGKRAILFYALFLASTTATAVVCYFTVRRVSVQRVLSCLVLISAWATLYGSQEVIQDWRAHRQVAALLHQIEPAAKALHDQWPTESGEIPPDIKFYVRPDKYPDVLSIRGPQPFYPFREALGLMIKRGKNGIIRFDLAAAFDSSVEFHPNNTLPAAHSSGFGYPTPPVASVTRLKDNWFLVRYGE